MAHRIQNTDFFKKNVEQTQKEAPKPPVEEEKPSVQAEAEKRSAQAERKVSRAEALNLGAPVKTAVRNAARTLKELGRGDAAAEIEKLLSRADRERFTVAVVGEFNRGKSTFLNHFLGQELVPVGDLPTTAVMTRIRYHKSDVLAAFDPNNQKVFERPLSPEAWEGLTAKNFGGSDFQGTALVGTPCQWLEKTNVEMMDTPGAGDLDEGRMRVLSDALLGCDGVIVAVDANQALSLSEKLFIEERLLTRKLPFIMMILTKLDRVRETERATVVQYVKDKLDSWKMDIPVFIPEQVSIPGGAFADCMGMERIKAEIEGWVACPQRVDMMEKWILGRTEDILEQALSSLREKELLLEAKSQQEREKLLAEKEQLLAQAELAWGELRLTMQRKCTECYDFLLARIDDYAASITERLQYEARHTNVPSQWWKEDFPYRVKMELTNLSVSLENLVSRQVQEDARWYSSAIEKTFHTNVLCKRTSIAEKEMFGNFAVGKELKFDNLDRKRNTVRVGTVVLSVAGFALFSAVGFLPIVATMGVGTGSAILSERFFKKKVEEQRQIIMQEIAQCVPRFIQSSLEESEKRLEAVYQDMIREAEQREQDWLALQRKAIQEAKLPGGEEEKLAASIEKAERQLAEIRGLM